LKSVHTQAVHKTPTCTDKSSENIKSNERASAATPTASVRAQAVVDVISTSAMVKCTRCDEHYSDEQSMKQHRRASHAVKVAHEQQSAPKKLTSSTTGSKERAVPNAVTAREAKSNGCQPCVVMASDTVVQSTASAIRDKQVLCVRAHSAARSFADAVNCVATGR
jgi:hypothetical protein